MRSPFPYRKPVQVQKGGLIVQPTPVKSFAAPIKTYDQSIQSAPATPVKTYETTQAAISTQGIRTPIKTY